MANSILIREVTSDYIPQWLGIAAEMEPIFEGSMVHDQGFHDYMKAKIEKGEAYMALDRENGGAVMGIIGFSRKNNQISWLGVLESCRGRGAGSRLLEAALRQLDSSKDIEVITFQEGYEAGEAARHVYHKSGFIDAGDVIVPQSDRELTRRKMRIPARKD